ncbi:MAG: hypothetical protein WDW38_010211 [Sanguina aurantia]
MAPQVHACNCLQLDGYDTTLRIATLIPSLGPVTLASLPAYRTLYPAPPASATPWNLTLSVVSPAPASAGMPSFAANQTLNPGLGHDGYVISSDMLAAFSRLGLATPIGPILSLDTGQSFYHNTDTLYRYNGTLLPLRAGAISPLALWATPLSGSGSLLYYRADVLAAKGIPAPVTWEEVLQLAGELEGQDFNGDGVPDYSFCMQRAGDCANSAFMSVLSSYLQLSPYGSAAFYQTFLTGGSLQPGAFALSGPVFQTLQQLSSYGPPSDATQCQPVPQQFVDGSCLMTIAHDAALFKAAATVGNASYVHDKMAVAPMPGTAMVLDISTIATAQCASIPDQCKYGIPTLLRNGSTQLVNFSPYFAPSAMGVVRASSPLQLQLRVLQFFGSMSGTDRSWELVLQPDSGITPFRSEHTSPANLDKWIAAGYSPSAAGSYLAALSSALSSANQCLPSVSQALDEAGAAMMLQLDLGQIPVLDIVVQFLINVSKGSAQEVVALYGGNATALQLDIIAHTGYVVPVFKVSVPASTTTLKVITSVSVVGGVLLILAGIVFLGLRNRTLNKDVFGKVHAPDVGPDTTIVVVKIQDFDQLWEFAGMEKASERALVMFKREVARLLTKHSGYRSPSEEEVVLAAFHCPRGAAGFAMELQKDLLDLSWPAELLAHPSFTPKYYEPTYSNNTPLKAPPAIKEAPTETKPEAAGAAAPDGFLTQPSLPASRMDTADSGESGPRPAAAAAAAKDPCLPNSPFEGKASARKLEPNGTFERMGTASLKALAGFFLSLRASHLFQPHRLSQQGAGARNVQQQHPHVEDDEGDKLFTLDRGTEEGMRSFGDQCAASWVATNGTGAEGELVIRGLQITVALCGVCNSILESQLEPSSKRVCYFGEPVDIAMAIAEAGQGGMVIIPQQTFRQLHLEYLSYSSLFCHFGEYQVRQDLVPMDLYLAVDRTQLGRMSCFRPLRCFAQWSQGAFAAPVHSAAMVEHVDGFMLTAFYSPEDAILWGLRVQELMLRQPWPVELLQHALCEEVTVNVPNRSGEMTQATVFRGPRLKTGIDIGEVLARLHTMTGRMTYRGRVMNRAARISAASSSGQVLCSSDAWSHCKVNTMSSNNVSATSLGMFQLKGILEDMEMFHCTYQHAAPLTQHRNSMASYSKSRRATGSSNATWTSALNIANSAPHLSSRNTVTSQAAGAGGMETEDMDLVATFAAHIMERDRGVAPGSPRRPAVQTYYQPRLGSREVRPCGGAAVSGLGGGSSSIRGSSRSSASEVHRQGQIPEGEEGYDSPMYHSNAQYTSQHSSPLHPLASSSSMHRHQQHQGWGGALSSRSSVVTVASSGGREPSPSSSRLSPLPARLVPSGSSRSSTALERPSGTILSPPPLGLAGSPGRSRQGVGRRASGSGVKSGAMLSPFSSMSQVTAPAAAALAPDDGRDAGGISIQLSVVKSE